MSWISLDNDDDDDDEDDVFVVDDASLLTNISESWAIWFRRFENQMSTSTVHVSFPQIKEILEPLATLS